MPAIRITDEAADAVELYRMRLRQFAEKRQHPDTYKLIGPSEIIRLACDEAMAHLEYLESKNH